MREFPPEYFMEQALLEGRKARSLCESNPPVGCVLVSRDIIKDSVKFQGKMKSWSRIADSGNTSGAMFYPTCGNRIYHFDPNEPDKLKLKPSNLSDTSIINPTIHVWVSEKQAWYQIPDGVKVFDKQP